MSGTITGRHVRVRHGAPVTRSTHGVGYSPEAATGATDLYGGMTDEQVGEGGIQPESLQLSKFTQGLRPVAIVDTLPALPDNQYPVGSTVVYTVDGKLYRNEADTWTAEVDTTDLDGEITETQIADDSISTPKLQANAVTADKILAGEINAGHLAADSVTSGAIEAGAVTATEIDAGAIETEHFAATATISLVSNDGATVVINADGITISDGALVIEDEFGSTVATAGGFTGGWGDYVRTGLYNGNMRVGTTGFITLGRTSDLPYWTSSRTAGSPNAAGLTGGGLTISFTASGETYRLRSDAVEVTAGAFYYVPLVLQFIVAGGSPLMVVDVYIEWYTSAGVHITTTTCDSHTASFSVARSAYNSAPVAAPSDAAYAKLVVDSSQTSDHNAGNRIRPYALGLLPAPPENLTGYDLVVDTISATGVGTFGSVDTANVETIDADVQGTLQVAEMASLLGPWRFQNVISPSLLATTSDWSPTGLEMANVIRIQPDANRILTGINAMEDGRVILLVNGQTFTITLHHDVTSTAENRFYCPGAVNYVIPSRGSVLIWYDTISNRWRVIG